MTASVKWETTTVEKSLGTRREKHPETGKMRTVRTGTQEVPYTYPMLVGVMSFAEVAEQLQVILDAKQPGFDRLSVIVDHLNFGLYTDARNQVGRGADVRYTTGQRTLIRNVGNLAKQGLMERDIALMALQRQGVEGAEALVDAYMRGEEPEEDEDGA